LINQLKDDTLHHEYTILIKELELIFI
jgi:hypothetical protein